MSKKEKKNQCTYTKKNIIINPWYFYGSTQGCLRHAYCHITMYISSFTPEDAAFSNLQKRIILWKKKCIELKSCRLKLCRHLKQFYFVQQKFQKGLSVSQLEIMFTNMRMLLNLLKNQTASIKNYENLTLNVIKTSWLPTGMRTVCPSSTPIWKIISI